jgi:hypothetical protein
MRIRIDIHRQQLARWHQWLVEALAALPRTQVTVRLVDAQGRDGAVRPQALQLVLDLEGLTTGLKGLGHQSLKPDDLQAAVLPRSDKAVPEVIVDLTDQDDAQGSGQARLVPMYDHHFGEAAFWDAVFDGRPPELGLYHSERGLIQVIGTPALETPQLIGRSGDAIRTRLIQGIVAAVQSQSTARSISETHPAFPILQTADLTFRPATQSRTVSGHLAAPGALLRRLGERAASKLKARLSEGPTWSVASRSVATAANPMIGDTRLRLSDFHILPDDGQRYYADPFAYQHAGTTHVFVEEFPFATERGIISVASVDAAGRFTSRPRPVLEASTHLSYPQVFAWDDDIWMIPESAASGAIELYRAERFPDQWVLERRLIEGRLHDATLHIEAEMLWLFASGDTGQSSSWDSLHIFQSPHLTGPWTAVADHPVKIDLRSSRPGGSLVRQDGRLFRPTQDCSSGYGSALTWTEIHALSKDRFCEAPVGRMSFGDGRKRLGPHTWNRLHVTGSQSLELIDCYGPRPSVQTSE